jgi:hypothetical protein
MTPCRRTRQRWVARTVRNSSQNLWPKQFLGARDGQHLGQRVLSDRKRECACHPAAFSGTLPSMESEIYDKLPYNSR